MGLWASLLPSAPEEANPQPRAPLLGPHGAHRGQGRERHSRQVCVSGLPSDDVLFSMEEMGTLP